MMTMEVGSKSVFVMTPWSKLIMADNSCATLIVLFLPFMGVEKMYDKHVFFHSGISRV